MVIKTWMVPYSISDKSIHKFLKSREDVIWENEKNTEEFLFINDDGSGENATEIIEKIIETLACPDFILRKLRRLEKSIDFSIENEMQKIDDVKEKLCDDINKFRKEKKDNVALNIELDSLNVINDALSRDVASLTVINESLIQENEEIQKENRKLKSRASTNSTRLEALSRTKDTLNQKLENNEKTLASYRHQKDLLRQELGSNKKLIDLKEEENKQSISEMKFYGNMFLFTVFAFVLTCFYSYSLFVEAKERDAEIAILNEKMNSQSIEIKQLKLALDQSKKEEEKYFILAHQALFDPSSISLEQKNEMCQIVAFYENNGEPLWPETANIKINCK